MFMQFSELQSIKATLINGGNIDFHTFEALGLRSWFEICVQGGLCDWLQIDSELKTKKSERQIIAERFTKWLNSYGSHYNGKIFENNHVFHQVEFDNNRWAIKIYSSKFIQINYAGDNVAVFDTAKSAATFIKWAFIQQDFDASMAIQQK